MPRIIIPRRQNVAGGAPAGGAPNVYMPVPALPRIPQNPLAAQRRLQQLAPSPSMVPLARQAIEYENEAGELSHLQRDLSNRGDQMRAQMIAPQVESGARQSQEFADALRRQSERADETQRQALENRRFFVEQERERLAKVDQLRDFERGVREIDDDLSLQWMRRNRVNGSRKDLRGVPAQRLQQYIAQNFPHQLSRKFPEMFNNLGRIYGATGKTNGPDWWAGKLTEDIEARNSAIAEARDANLALEQAGRENLSRETQELQNRISQGIDQGRAQRDQMEGELRDIYAQSSQRRGPLMDSGTDPAAVSSAAISDENSQSGKEISQLQAAIYNQNLSDTILDFATRKQELAQTLERQGYSPNSDAYRRQMAAFDKSQNDEIDKVAASSLRAALNNQSDYLGLNRQADEDLENQYRFDMGIEQAEKQDEINRFRKRENLFWGNKFRAMSNDQNYWNRPQNLGDAQPIAPIIIPTRESYHGQRVSDATSAWLDRAPERVLVGRAGIGTRPADAQPQERRPQRASMGVGSDDDQNVPQRAEMGVGPDDDQNVPQRAEMGVGPDDDQNVREFVQAGAQPSDRFFRRDFAGAAPQTDFISSSKSQFSEPTINLFRSQTQNKEQEINDEFKSQRDALSANLVRRGFTPSSTMYQRQMADLNKKRNSALRDIRESGWDKTFKNVSGLAKSQSAIDEENENRYRFDYAMAKAQQRDLSNIAKEREDLYWANRFAAMQDNPRYFQNAGTNPDLGLQKPAPIRIPTRNEYISGRPLAPRNFARTLFKRGS
jgi:hypothetical protein